MTFSLRFIIPLALVFLALPPIWWVFETTEQRSNQQVEERADKELTSQMTQIRGNLENLLRSEDEEQIRKGFASLGVNPNIEVAYLIDAEDRIYASTQGTLIGKSAYPSIFASIAESANEFAVELEKVREENGGIVFQDADGDSLVGMHPIRLGRDSPSISPTKKGVLLIVYDLHEKRAAAQAVVREQAAQISVVYIGLMLFLGIFLHVLVTRRISRLSVAATRVAAGDFSMPVPAHGRDEISHLGRTFNAMATQRAKSEKIILKNERRLQSILDNTQSLIYIKDLEGRFLLVNRMFDSLPRTTALHAVGHTDFDLFPERDAKQFRAHDEVVLNSRSPMEFREVSMLDGVLHTFLSTKFCLLDEEGEPYALCGISTDITSSVHAEERDKERALDIRRYQRTLMEWAKVDYLDLEHALKRATELSAEALDVERVSVWMYTPDRSAIVCSDLYIASQQTHRSGQRLEAVQAPTYFQTIEQSGMVAIHDVQHDPRTSELTTDYLAVEGITSMMDVGIRLRGELVGIVCHEHIGALREWSLEEQEFALSISNTVSLALEAEKRREAEEARKNLEQKILHAQKSESLGVLAGGIAHDFNNLLLSILGNADLALSNLPLDSPLQQELSAIEEAAKHAAALCDQLLAYSGKGRTQLVSVNLSSLVEGMVSILNVSISKKAVLRCSFDDTLPAIKADPTQLRQIIMNLVTNSSEATEETSGFITVTTGVVHCDWSDRSDLYGDEDLEEGEYVFAEVSDTGCGMDPDTYSKIFDPFFTTKFTGRGLGMAAVLGIVRSHYGAIRVKSAPGLGTTFTIFFPVAHEFEAPAEHTAPPVAETKWRGQGTVLLVDDEKMIRKLTGRILKQMGFEVLLAEDGLEAVETFKKHTGDIDCVMLDLIMPKMDGDTCFRELRTIKSDVRILLTSGYNEHEVSHRFGQKGQVGFIQKPYDLDSLRTKLQQVLDR